MMHHWCELVSSGHSFKPDGGIASKDTELDCAESPIPGSRDKIEAAFCSLSSTLVHKHPIISSCVLDGSSLQDNAEVVGYYRQRCA